MRYAFRSLLKHRGFTLVAVLAIAFGVGPNSAVFSIIHSVLLQPLPIPEADRTVIVWETNTARGAAQMGVSGRDLLDWRREARSFVGFSPGNAGPDYAYNLTGGGEPERVVAARIGDNFCDLLGIRPVVGRAFLPEEGGPGGQLAVLLSNQLWQRRFHGDRAIVGASIGLDGHSYRVAGVLPPEMRSIGSVDVWISNTEDLAGAPRNERRFGVFGRLKPGVTIAQAQAEMDAIQLRLARQYPDTNANIGAVLLPVSSVLNTVRPAFLMLAAAVGFLLLIACANVAGLLLARGAAREKEIAVRAAIGATRGRIVRQLVGESLILAGVGGVAGLALAGLSLRLLRNALPDVIPRLKEMGVDATVLAFTVGASIITGVLFGIVPALRLARTDVGSMLNDGGGKGTTSSGAQRGRTVLLAVEVALAVVLLAGAGLLIRSFAGLSAVDPGFRPGGLLTAKLSLPDARYGDPASRAIFTRELLRRVAAQPGVRAASVISSLPLRSYFLNLPANVRAYRLAGDPELPPSEQPTADVRTVGTDFLAAMGIRLARGRDLTAHDDHESRPVALVNEALVRRAGADVLGRRVRIGGDQREIVGVVPDVRLQSLDGAVRPAIFIPYDQLPSPVFTLVVRSPGDPAALSAAIRREVLAIDGQQPISDVQPMDDVIADSLLLRRLSMSMLTVFAALAVLLAGVGLYGLTAYSVSRRTREIGVRMALGADRGDILRLVVGRGLLTGVAGVALGLPGALAVGRIMRGMLYGIGPSDPVVFIGVSALLVGIAAVASYVPARRALRVDPVVALKSE